MARKQGRVHGKLAYREGDGVEIPIPEGPCEIEITGLDVTLTWLDGDIVWPVLLIALGAWLILRRVR